MSKDAPKTWKETLGSAIPEAWGREIDIFETQIELRKKGKIEEKLFAETRLRRGTYGQRYDNGQRHDGETTQTLRFPSGEITKGPITLWDAPGMQRIKIPFGALTADQLDRLAELAEEYSDRILHVTTRQDFQLHFVHIDDTPDLMRRLAAAGITTREACGNTVRNVTGCPQLGVCQTEAFDITPYAKAITFFLLGHDDTQNFGRKFKVAFSGCADNAVRADQLSRRRLHRAHAHRRRKREARLRILRGRRPRLGAAERAALRPVLARGRAAADDARRWGVCSAASARRRTAPRRGSSS